MAWELHRDGFPGIAASAVNPGVAVKLDSGAHDRQVVPLATSNAEPFGVTLATAANPGDGVTVLESRNVIKVTAIASLGENADIGVASTNGGLAPVAAASGVSVWRVGKALSSAAAGEVFSLYVHPRQLSNLA